MKRLLIVLLAFAGILAAGATPALAADSTCSNHDIRITGWSLQLDNISHSGDFQCGGANNESWNAELFLQYKNGAGNWITAACPNGYLGLCISFKPVSGWFGGGERHTWTGTFNTNEPGGIDCRTWRMRAGITFHGGSPTLYYNGSPTPVGGC